MPVQGPYRFRSPQGACMIFYNESPCRGTCIEAPLFACTACTTVYRQPASESCACSTFSHGLYGVRRVQNSLKNHAVLSVLRVSANMGLLDCLGVCIAHLNTLNDLGHFLCELYYINISQCHREKTSNQQTLICIQGSWGTKILFFWPDLRKDVDKGVAHTSTLRHFCFSGTRLVLFLWLSWNLWRSYPDVLTEVALSKICI